jgi:hypothetical protein
MFNRHIQTVRRAVGRFALLSIVSGILAGCVPAAGASATLLLEEPYGKLGFFTATGHAAVYLSGVCAETPLVLRPCKRGETGFVISRYDGVNGHDWIAIPLIPYLFAVDRPEDVPLFADAKMTAFLRDRYRRKYLEDVAPDAKNGETPGGNWYELVGSSYDRTIYGFDIETTPAQDAALIRKLNASANQSHFHTVYRNCADFAKDIINFYYPKALHRSVVADVGIATPKQMAKALVKYSTRHPQIRFSRLVIAQVPGSMPRSAAVHGVVESFFKSKKYFVPSVVVSPIFAGCVFAVYEGTGAGRFQPAQNAKVYVVGGDPEKQLDHEDLRAYQLELKHMLAGAYPEASDRHADRAWEKLQSHAEIGVDEQGRPTLEMQVGDELLRVGDSANTVTDGGTPPQLMRQLLEARLESELLHRSPHGITESEIDRDWKLLEQSMGEGDSPVASRSTPRPDARGNTQ